MSNVFKTILCLFTVMMVFQTASSGADLTNANKREIAYRMYGNYKKNFSSVNDISPREAMRLMKTANVLFVDVRRPAEIKVSKLPNAITSEEFLKNP